MQDGAKIRTADRFYHVQSVLTQLGTISFIHSWKEKEGKLSFFVLYICHKEFILGSKNNYQYFVLQSFQKCKVFQNFKYSEVFDTLLIQKSFVNIENLLHYWSLNYMWFSASSTFVSQQTPLLLRKFQKMQLCYCNSQKTSQKMLQSNFCTAFLQTGKW